MQDKRIDQLPRAKTINGDDLFVISRNGLTNSMTFSVLFKPVYEYIKELILNGEIGGMFAVSTNETAVESKNQTLYNVQIEDVNKLQNADSTDLMMIYQDNQSCKIAVGELYGFLARAADQEYMGMYLHRPTWDDLKSKTWAEIEDRSWDSDSEGL